MTPERPRTALVVSFYFPPSLSVAAGRPVGIAKALADSGYAVTVLTTNVFGDLPHNTLAGYESRITICRAAAPWLSRLGRALGVSFLSTDNATESKPVQRNRLMRALNRWRIRRGLLVLGRMPDLFDLWSRPALRCVRDQQWDVVWSTYAPVACHRVGLELKRRGKVGCWIADFRDPWTRSHQFSGLFPFSWFERRLERRICRVADVVSSVSEELCAEFQQLTSKTVLCMTNGFDPLPQTESEGVTTDDSPAGAFNLVHTGTLYADNPNVDVLLAALGLLDRQQANIRLLHAGRDLGNRSAEARALKHVEVRDEGQVSRQKALQMQRRADVLVFIGLDDHPGVTTGKIFEYISTGRPVLYIGRDNNGSALRLLRETRTLLGCASTPEMVVSLLSEAQKRTRSWNPDTEAIARFERTRVANQFLADLEKVLSRKR